MFLSGAQPREDAACRPWLLGAARPLDGCDPRGSYSPIAIVAAQVSAPGVTPSDTGSGRALSLPPPQAPKAPPGANESGFPVALRLAPSAIRKAARETSRLARVAASNRRGFTPRSTYSASCLRRNRISASSDLRGRTSSPNPADEVRHHAEDYGQRTQHALIMRHSQDFPTWATMNLQPQHDFGIVIIPLIYRSFAFGSYGFEYDPNKSGGEQAKARHRF